MRFMQACNSSELPWKRRAWVFPTIRPDRLAVLFRLHCSQSTNMQIYCIHIFLA
jgi:hypothetical protein